MTTKAMFERAMQSRLLSSEEERTVFEYYKEHHTKEVRNAIALKNEGLIYDIVSNYTHLGVDKDELFQEGFFGLIIAIERFDCRKGFKFSTYAYHWIRNSVGRYILNYGRTIRLPVYLSEVWMKIKNYQRTYEQKYGVQPTIEDIAENLNFSLDKVKNTLYLIKLNDTLSLEYKTKNQNDGDETELMEIIRDNSPDVADRVIMDMQQAELNEIMDVLLTNKEKDVLTYRFGLNGESPRTLEEVGMLYGVTRERIRQIEKQALKKMQHSRYRRNLEDMLEGLSA